MGKTIIISVGTSILQNHMRLIEWNENLFVTRLLKAFENNSDYENYYEGAKQGIKERLLSLQENGLDNKYTYNSPQKAIHYTSAEIHSLYKYYQIEENRPPENDPDKIILLCTDTQDSKFCAKIIRDEVLTKWKYFTEYCTMESNNNLVGEYGIKTISNLNFINPANWINVPDYQIDPNCGIAHLKEEILEIQNIYPNDVKIIIRTGGFKEFSADLKNCAFEFGLTSYYLFEEADNLTITNPRNPKENLASDVLIVHI